MSRHHKPAVADMRMSRFPLSLMFLYFGAFLLLSGIHAGLLVLMRVLNAGAAMQSGVLLLSR